MEKPQPYDEVINEAEATADLAKENRKMSELTSMDAQDIAEILKADVPYGLYLQKNLETNQVSVDFFTKELARFEPVKDKLDREGIVDPKFNEVYTTFQRYLSQFAEQVRTLSLQIHQIEERAKVMVTTEDSFNPHARNVIMDEAIKEDENK